MNRTQATIEQVLIAAENVKLAGELVLPRDHAGIVVFAHGSGSSRLSPRNRHVAEFLQEGNLGTLLLDMLTPEEQAIDERTRHLRFDIDLLTRRLVGTIDWIGTQDLMRQLPIGLFGASTGAAAALAAAAQRADVVAAVVSRGGRPDLAAEALPRVTAPVLLIVGSYDSDVIQLNRQAADRLRCERRLEIVAGASHLFEEPGKLEDVSRLARAWFQTHLMTTA